MTTLPLAIPLAGDPLAEKTSTEMDYWKSEVILSSIIDPNDDSDVNGDSFKDTANRMQVSCCSISYQPTLCGFELPRCHFYLAWKRVGCLDLVGQLGL